jgi:hypothetical protein
MGRLTILLLFLASLSCSSIQQRQGIKGHVFWVTGNQLPGLENSRSAHAGIQREILVYKLTTLRQATRMENGFFKDIETSMVISLVTKPDGSFKLRLPPGNYSIFVKEKEGLFANLFDKDNAINPVVVKDKQYSWLPITVDYEATY